MKGTRSAAALAVIAAVFPSSAAAETLARWPLDEGSGQVTADASGKGHDGRLGVLAGIDSHDPDWVTGRFANALRFDGESNEFVTVEHQAGSAAGEDQRRGLGPASRQSG